MKKEKKRKAKQFDQMEVYRNLRTNIEYSSVDHKIQVLNITSAQPNEGKSTIAANLAMVSASKDTRVLLVDCDLRKPSVHKHFNMTNRLGLSDILIKDDVDMSNLYFQNYENADFEGNLFILAGGVKVPNTLELLSSSKFEKFIVAMRQQFDFIILDCPPILSVSDVVPVSRVADGTLFVVSSKDTNKKDARVALQQLQRNGANVIGTVLNKVDKKTESYYYSYY